jgi:hypothetical protein
MEIASPSDERFRLKSRKAAELVAYLALRRNSVVHRDAVAEALWPEADLETGRNRLKQTLAVLRREVSELPVETHGKHEIELARDRTEIDFHALQGRLKWFRSLAEPNRSEAARQLWEATKEGLLPGFEAPWITLERRRYRVFANELERELQGAPASDFPRFKFGESFGERAVPIVGREVELELIRNWMVGDDHRTLYLVGPPGVGKTRLMEEAIEASRDVYDAVIFLSTVQRSASTWLERLSQAVGIRDTAQVTISLNQLLRGFRRPILALDDADQAPADMQAWIYDVMSAVPSLRVLGSARTTPTDPRTRVCEIRPLQTNVAGDLMMSLASHFGLSESDAHAHESTLVELADHLEGLPLALEVAASWLPFIDAESLLRRIKSTPDLVVQRAQGRQDSIASCISALRARLAVPEQEALLNLSVCQGGCGAELVQGLMGSDWLWKVRALTERSLAISTKGLSGPRFHVLQAIRDSVLLIEGTENTHAASGRHRDACLDLAEKAAYEISEGDRPRWLRWLRDEADNVLSACASCLDDPGLLDRAMVLLYDLSEPMWAIGRADKHIKLDLAARAKGLTRVEELSVGAQISVAWFHINNCIAEEKWEKAAEIATQIRERVDQSENDFMIARANHTEGLALMRLDPQSASPCFERASEHYLRAGYPRHALWEMANVAKAATLMGLLAEAKQLKRLAYERSLELADYNSAGMYQKEFAFESLLDHDWAAAKELSELAVESFERAGEVVTRFDAMSLLVAAHLGLGDVDQAEKVLAEAAGIVPLDDRRRQNGLAHLWECAGASPSRLPEFQVIKIGGI